MASNFQEILSQLRDRHVDFVIVGGVAAAFSASDTGAIAYLPLLA